MEHAPLGKRPRAAARPCPVPSTSIRLRLTNATAFRERRPATKRGRPVSVQMIPEALFNGCEPRSCGIHSLGLPKNPIFTPEA